MKKNSSVFILILEIISIAFLHGMKIKQTQNAKEFSNISKANPAKQDANAKSSFFFLKIK
ncbi:MAG: hypothetical protein ACHQEM_10755 [Chitinophagales bacterium]